CDSSGNCQSADGGYIGGLGNDNYLTKFTGSYSVGDSIVYDNGSQVGIGTSTPSRKLTVEGKIYATSQGTAAGEVITAGRILTAGTGLSGGGDLTQDRTFSVDYGSAAGTAVEGDTQVTVTAGDAITGGGTITLGSGGTVTLNHQDTSSQASVDNSDGTVIQDVTLDTYGHLTAITSYDLDNRYYTETESDSRFVNVTGDTMSGDLTMTGTAANVILGSNWLSGDGGDEGVYVDSLGQVGIGTSTPSAKLAVSGSVMVEGDLQFMGNSSIQGSGTLTLNPSGNLELQSSANYIDESGNLVVSGRVDTDTLQYSGSITINATSSGATTVVVANSDGRAVANLQIEGDIDVQGGKITLADGETISAETSDHIVISSGGTEVLDIVSGGVSITGNVTTTDRLYVTSGGANITGRVDITGLTTITGDTSITGNVTTTGALVVQNGADITGALASEQLTVSGQTDLRGSVLNTTGNFTISDSVDMSGDLSLTGNSANVVFSGTGDHLLSVTSGTLKLGTSTLAGDITGAGYQISDLGRLTVDNLILDGNTLNTASGNLVLDSNSGTTQISDSLIVTGLLEVQGNFASSSFAGQVELFGTPDGTAVDQGSLYVNPATAGVNNTLLGVAVSDVQKMRFDAEGDMEISGTFSSTGGGTSQFSGGLSVLGSLTLGDEISDIIDVKGRFSSSLVPSEDAAYTLGLPDYRWSNFYVATATIDNLIAGGSASSTFIINTDNASADAEDSQLEFERGSAAPNAVFKWNSTDDRFEFNDFSVYMANSLNVAGDETSSFAGPSLFTGTPLGTGVGQGSLYINPSSGLSDYTVFSVAVNDNERFRVDAEGDTTVQGSLGIENYIYDITQDTLLIDDDLQVGGGDIKDAGGNIRITLGATNTITGNLAVSTGYIT
ncbi:MAG: hypothetical protein WCS62_06755, partial [Bacilli bacterium]